MSIPVSQKKRGRPATGETPRVGVRLAPETIGRVDAFAASEGIDRSEAIRRLVVKGLGG
jgi:metal-responsive CopG/Arc/MetJ family transcriptional regulator